MAMTKLLVASIAIVIAIMTVGVRSDDTINCEIDELRSKVSALESSIVDKIHEIRTKEDIIVRLDTIIQEKMASIGSLENRIKSLQTVKLGNEIEAESKKGDAFSVRDSEAEKKVHELNLKLESVLGAWLPPWLATHISHIQDLAVTHWNQHAKPSVIHILHKASRKTGEVQEWAEYSYAFARTEWIPAAKEQLLIFKSNVIPCLQMMTANTFEVYEASKSTIAPHIVKLQEVADPYFQEWIPAAKEQLLIFKSNVIPCLQMMTANTFEVYEASKSTIAPHIVKLQEVADPYFQEAKEFSRPYFNQIIRVTGPHVEKFRVWVPFINHVAHSCYELLCTARTYHSEVQKNMYEKLKMHQLTKPYATKELTWVVASILLAFPVFFLYRVLAAVFCKSAKKSRRSAHASHRHRRPKRRYEGR